MESSSDSDQEVLRYQGVNQQKGLSSEEAARRLKIYGPNIVVLPHEKEITNNIRFLNLVRSWLNWDVMMLNPVSWISFVAPLAAFIMFVIVGNKLYMFEALVIMALLLFNFICCFIAMRRAETAMRSLFEGFNPKTKVLRDGTWKEEDPTNLVPGDIIFLKWGDIVPADVRLVVNNKVTTMLSMYSRGVHDGSMLYCGSSLFYGEGIAVVVATGGNIPIEHINVSVIDFDRPGQLKKSVVPVGIFCFSLVTLGTVIELVVMMASKHGSQAMLHNHCFILLIGAIPFAMPAVLSLLLALGSHRLSQLGIATRGTVGIENLAIIDIFSFNMTGTLTLNKPRFDPSKIDIFHKDISVDDVIHIAAKTCFKECSLYQEPLDAAITDMLSNPEAVNYDIEEEAGYCPYNFYDRVSSRSYRAKDGLYYSAIKGDPYEVMKMCEYSTELEDLIDEKLEYLARDGYQALAIAQQEFLDKRPSAVGPAWKFIALMPFKDDLRKDCVETISSITDMGLHVFILTGGQKAITKEICKRFGMLETAVHYFKEMDKTKDMSKENAISYVYPESKRYVVKGLMEDHLCAMIGGGMYDTLALGECTVGISGPDASDKARSLSDLVMTKPSLNPLVRAIQISRDISEALKSYLTFSIASSVHVFGVLVILLIWRFSYSGILALVMAFFNYSMAFAFIGETTIQGKSQLRWRVKKMIAKGVCLGCYVILTTAMFFMALRIPSFLLGARSVVTLGDEEMRAALFLQMSVVNQAMVFFTTDRVGPLIIGSFSVSQMVTTLIAVYADIKFAQVRGISWSLAGLIWTYNTMLLLALRFIKSVACQYAPNASSWLQKKCM